MKYWQTNIFKFYFFPKKIHKKFKQHSIDINNYTAHPHEIVKYLQSFQKIVQNTSDGRTDGGHYNISRPGPSARREITRLSIQN